MAYLTEDLAHVPELMIGEPLAKNIKNTEEATRIVAKINHLNKKKDPDGFLKALLAHRGDLRGLPFLMGKACKTDVSRRSYLRRRSPMCTAKCEATMPRGQGVLG